MTPASSTMPAASGSSSTSKARAPTRSSSAAWRCSSTCSTGVRAAARPNTGDGAGILIQPPDRFLRKVTAALGITLPPAGQYGAGNIFLPRDAGERKQIRTLVEQIVAEEGQTLLGWRPVPTTQHVLGASAAAVMPVVEQLFVGYGGDVAGRASLVADPMRFERKLYVIRKRIEHAADKLTLAERHMFYIPSLSSKTLIYKGC